MRNIIFILCLFLTTSIFSQMSIDSKKITNLYNEPQSIQVVKNKWKSDSYEDRKTYTAVLASGLVMTGLCLYEGNESWKKSNGTNWIYKPFIKQSTRPYMLSVGLGMSVTGIIGLIVN